MHALSNSEIQVRAPSIFASEASGRVSGRFRFVNSGDAIEALAQGGYGVVSAAQANTRTRDPRYVRHTFDVQPLDFFNKDCVIGELIPRVKIANAHDGSLSWQVYAGFFRLYCLNGCVAAFADFESIRIPHSSKHLDNVLEGVFKVIEVSNRAAQACMDWTGTRLSRDAREEFAERALALRWPANPPVQASRLLVPGIEEDKHDTLFHNYQTVQRALTQGLATGTRRRAPRLQELNAIRLNQNLFRLAEEFASRG
jgi:hypothetical protein